ncbi:AraC family transcriptional regulator [Lactobacillus helveticus]|uniref:Raffinose operon transcriptional regulator n=1 Tax=Lactobacillus helveticus TaxID=1587 RepID=A0A386RCI0_LACHE|nr:helix-turn-helix domain-containing protein [Lactobacillus helveticus]AHI11233.1 Raffinose operon transcriptional regulatory protein RafR [Lactobacillus helveticus H9]AKG66102.1 AraC family transcriptional regulator [Lactobacillus helveticus]AYE60790.1 raffinose operon transcriptional regulator [Lactobacillus helveticus]MBO1882307.1 helix-turn-helix domain-containing protein [Lactobacillus helveticus]MCD9224844.1 helix-turn-helix domain-containing protein [Lactobacillus helveticus]
MPNQYHNLSNPHIESYILFYGQQKCHPNEYFESNNLQKNYVLYYILSGEGTFSSNGHHTVNLSQGDLFLIPRNTTCFFKADKDNPWEYLWLGLAGSDTKKIIEASNLPNKNFLRQIKRTEFYSILLELYEMLNKRKSLLTNLKIASLTSQFFYYLVKELPNHPPVRKTPKNDQYQIAINYLQKNYTDPNCNIVELCNRLGVSRSFLYSLFRENTNISPQKYLMQLRMEAAKKELQNTTSNLKEIAHKVGYGDEFTFSKAFKRYSGVSPNVFRRN